MVNSHDPAVEVLLQAGLPFGASADTADTFHAPSPGCWCCSQTANQTGTTLRRQQQCVLRLRGLQQGDACSRLELTWSKAICLVSSLICNLRNSTLDSTQSGCNTGNVSCTLQQDIKQHEDVKQKLASGKLKTTARLMRMLQAHRTAAQIWHEAGVMKCRDGVMVVEEAIV